MAAFSSHHLFYFFFFFFFLVILPDSTHSASPFPYHVCGKNFTESIILQTNIQNALVDMVAESSVHGYAITSYINGSTPAVYGVTRCQSDISLKACSACITAAALMIRSACPNSAQSHIWYETCFLRCDTRKFFGKWENFFAYVWLSANVTKNREEFRQAVGGVMGVVIKQAAEGGEKFAYGEKDVNKGVESVWNGAVHARSRRV